MSGVKRFYKIMKPRYLIFFIVNSLAFTQGLLMDDVIKFSMHSEEHMVSRYRLWKLMKKALLDIIGVVLFAYLAHSFGRKKSIISLGVISLLFQIIYVAILPGGFNGDFNFYAHPYYYLGEAHYYYDIACKFVNSAPLVISTIYIGETAEDCNRGAFVSSYILSNRLGQLIFIVAKFWEFLNYLRLANILLSVVFVAAAFWLPETPLYLLLNNRTEDAKKALSLLQGNSNVDEGELQDLIVSIEKSNSSNRSIMSYTTNPATRKALIIGSVTLILNRLLYTQLLLTDYFPSEVNPIRWLPYDENVYTIDWEVFFIGPFLEIYGVILTVLLADRCGRKFLLLVSCANMAFIYSLVHILNIFNQFGFGEDWSENYFPWLDPTMSVLSFVMYDVGCGTVPYILLSELLQTHARVSGITFCYIFYCLLTYLLQAGHPFITLTIYSQIFGLCLIFTIFFCSFLFTYHCIPETKGKSLQDIAEMLKRQG